MAKIAATVEANPGVETRAYDRRRKDIWRNQILKREARHHRTDRPERNRGRERTKGKYRR
jgi:hypothetical protein